MTRLLLSLALLAAVPAAAQVPTPQTEEDQQPAPQPLPPLDPTQPGRVAESSAGVAGQRQTRDATLGFSPTARLSSRIQNRVQSRIRNRIDRNYDPQANATSPFVVAGDQARTAGRPGR